MAKSESVSVGRFLGEILPVSVEFSQKIGTRQLPKLTEHYESNVRGLYIVGDLADAPVIKISLKQGYDVIERLVARDFQGPRAAAPDGVLDILVIGAGPAGIGAALACKKHGLTFEVVERERPFNTIQNYPKHKHIFSEPRTLEGLARFPFVDRIKEDLVAEWGHALDDNALTIRQPEEVVDITKVGDLFEVHTVVGQGERAIAPAAKPGEKLIIRARRVILAIGRRGNVNKLGARGEDHPKVAYGLADPDRHAGQRVLVVGGGDSAVEAAIALAQAGATVAISYRQDSFSRAKALNQERIRRLIEEGRIQAFFKTIVKEITDDQIILKGEGGDVELANDRVFVLIGTSLPIPFLRRIGVVMEGDFSWQRMLWISSFALMTYLFYVIKTKRGFFPFGPDDFLGGVHDAIKVPLGKYVGGGPRYADGSFWGTVLYSLMITGFGIQAIKKYRSPIQTKRYLCLILFQLVFLFAIPELIAPLLIDNPWRMYALSVPWPLSIWSLYHAEVGWFVMGAGVAFVGIPLFVRFNGERFCSWACGCGGLAETLGDRWRHLAPRGSTSILAEKCGRVILVLAAVTTFLILGHDIFRFLTTSGWSNAKQFAQHWYGLMVDFWFACVVGVAFYPYLGNRVWCRFLCPLRAYMELLSKWFGRLKITANERCIGCSECTRYCQMGIQVQKFAQMREDLANHNSACIQCGICVEVCPMDVLSVVRAPTSTRTEAKTRRSLPIVTH